LALSRTIHHIVANLFFAFGWAYVGWDYAYKGTGDVLTGAGISIGAFFLTLLLIGKYLKPNQDTE